MIRQAAKSLIASTSRPSNVPSPAFLAISRRNIRIQSPQSTGNQPRDPESSSSTVRDPSKTESGSLPGQSHLSRPTAAAPTPFEADLPDQPDITKLPSLDIHPEAALPTPEDRQNERTGAGRREYVSSIERQRRMLLRGTLGILAIGGVAAAVYLSRKDAGDVRRCYQTYGL